jgi:hypothetical protein
MSTYNAPSNVQEKIIQLGLTRRYPQLDKMKKIEGAEAIKVLDQSLELGYRTFLNIIQPPISPV